VSFTEVMEWVSRGFETVGIAVLVVGFLTGAVKSLLAFAEGQREGAYDLVRRYFGRSILLGLEILIAADLIRTVAIDPTMRNVLVLGLIILIRTFLSFTLEIEIDGIVPWRRWRLGASASRPEAETHDEGRARGGSLENDTGPTPKAVR
jgi:uncharacterized membrane protein